jgi:hypothetical protein
MGEIQTGVHAFWLLRKEMKIKIVLAGLGSAALVFAPSASADVPGLAPFVGTWQKHDTRLVIDNTGTGVDTYPDIGVCPDCSEADAPRGTLTFTLTPRLDGVAVGSITASSDPANHAVGAPVTAMLTVGSPGQLLQLTVDGMPQLPFCDNAAAATGQCGA